ncbi:hypothetical protein VZC37_09755 [Gordonia sp. LSe1-13]|uniref:Tat pathway signal protein n=2 Tax=Gordonia TaxID=2053 RepID=A0ABU7MBZ2_9ACTN|nr:hypothetical protein [Gordonia sp. LSe1-13]MEE3850619.1 hypothetical protein [Gordonia sp. LSe1-13]MEE4022781.1 hypothetical protein [Gordonia sp. PKS22-38]
MSRVTTPLTRRAVLRGGLAATAGAITISAVAACDRGPSPEQITAAALLPLADAALADQAAATALAPLTPEYANALGVVAAQRGEHAQSLREEITRLDQETAGRIASTGAAAGSSAPNGPSGAPAPPAPTVSTVAGMRDLLRQSARTSAQATGSLSGYPAGLAGAISASVTSMVEVQLA